jgi:spore coat protein CotF
MAFGDFLNQLVPQAREVGQTDAIKQWGQMPLLNNPQQLAQYATLAQGLRGLYNSMQQPSFEPIKNEYMRAYRENTLPGLLSNFTGNMQGGDYQRAVAQGDIDLATRLAGLQANFQQHQFDKNREFTQGLLQQGMKPSQENVYYPVPYEAATQYLQRQGIPNPTQGQIDQVLPMFSPPKPLDQQLGSFAQSVKNKGMQAVNAYQNQGIKGVANLIKGETPLANTQANQAGPQTVQEVLAQTPQVKKALDQSLSTASTEQKSAADWIVANKRAAIPLLSKQLDPQDYPMLKDLMENPKPLMQTLAYSLSTKKEFDELRKVLETNDDRKIRKYLVSKFGEARVRESERV